MSKELIVNNQLSVLSDSYQEQMIQQRNHIIQFSDIAPKYLLAKEILMFFDHVDNSNHLILFKTMWVTGGRVSEVLSLKPKNFCFFGFNGCMLTMPNLKQKKTSNHKKKVNDENSIAIKRLILSNMTNNATYIKDMKRYIVTNKLRSDDFIFKNAKDQVYNRHQITYLIKKIQNVAEKEGVHFPFKISPHTFRHSCAMHLYYSGASEKYIKEYLGHAHIRNTQIYTRLFHHEEDVSHIKFFG